MMPKITTISQFANYFGKLWLEDKGEELARDLESELARHLPDIVGHGISKKEAFEKVINTPGIHTTLEVPAVTVRNYRFRTKNQYISSDKMDEVLKKAGYKIVQEQKWRKE